VGNNGCPGQIEPTGDAGQRKYHDIELAAAHLRGMLDAQ
jgi:hypothetical protein